MHYYLLKQNTNIIYMFVVYILLLDNIYKFKNVKGFCYNVINMNILIM